MGVRLLTSGITPQWFTPESQAESIGPAAFYLRPISEIQKITVWGLIEGDRGQAVLEVLKMSLLDWRGVIGENGQEIAFRPELIEQLPAYIAAEIFGEALRLLQLSEPEKKT